MADQFVRAEKEGRALQHSLLESVDSLLIHSGLVDSLFESVDLLISLSRQSIAHVMACGLGIQFIKGFRGRDESATSVRL